MEGHHSSEVLIHVYVCIFIFMYICMYVWKTYVIVKKWRVIIAQRFVYMYMCVYLYLCMYEWKTYVIVKKWRVIIAQRFVYMYMCVYLYMYVCMKDLCYRQEMEGHHMSEVRISIYKYRNGKYNDDYHESV
jgi:hypothetical protein